LNLIARFFARDAGGGVKIKREFGPALKSSRQKFTRRITMQRAVDNDYIFWKEVFSLRGASSVPHWGESLARAGKMASHNFLTIQPPNPRKGKW